MLAWGNPGEQRRLWEAHVTRKLFIITSLDIHFIVCEWEEYFDRTLRECVEIPQDRALLCFQRRRGPGSSTFWFVYLFFQLSSASLEN